VNALHAGTNASHDDRLDDEQNMALSDMRSNQAGRVNAAFDAVEAFGAFIVSFLAAGRVLPACDDGRLGRSPNAGFVE
jgi:hypothetical protein